MRIKTIVLVAFSLFCSFAIAQQYVIPPRFDVALPFSEGLALVRINKKFGYVDKKGKLAIPAKFDDAGKFSDGLARVFLNGKYGFIDRTGNIVIPPRFESAGDFVDGRSVVQIDKFGLMGRKGVIDKNGTFVVNPIYWQIFDFQEQLAIVVGELSGGAEVGAIDLSGSLVIPKRFEYIHGFSGGVASALETNGRWGVIDPKGRWITAPQFDSIGRFTEGLAPFWDCGGRVHRPYRFAPTKNCKVGYINTSGRIMINAQFADARNFSDGRAAVQFIEHENAPWGYIDRNGKLVIDPVYGTAYEFREGYAVVSSQRQDANNWIWSLINKDGKVIFPAMVWPAHPSEGLISVYDSSGKAGYIEFEGYRK